MLKYENVISRLSESAKVDILTNILGLTERELITMGVPAVKAGALANITENIFPSPAMLANSWNCELVGRVGEVSAAYMASKGIGIALTPAAHIKLNPYRTAISEDTHLASSLAASYALGADSMGLKSCVLDFGLESDETAWLDRIPDERVIYEYIVRPYAEVFEKKKMAVCVKEDIHVAGYDNRNHDLAGLVADGKLGDGVIAVSEELNAENTVKYINQGVICLQGAGYAVQAALRKYVKVKKAVDRGEMKEEELLDEVRRGSAISPEMLDAAVDRMIAFASECTPKYIGEQEAQSLIGSIEESVARESIVLLKNLSKLLPASKKTKIAIIGDLATADAEWTQRLSERLQGSGANVIGIARGYDINSDIPNDALAGEALELAKKADVTLLFVGTDKKREKYITRTRNLSLPANQDILAQNIAEKYAKHTVAVLSSNYALDISTVDELGALMLAPIGTHGSAEALADAVCGKYSPSGKLASSLYRNTDYSLAKQQNYMQSGVKAGRFIGYRYYDTADWNIGYPFGHGIGYAVFSYSALSVKNDCVTFTVKNSGRMAAAEVVQVYVGIEDPSSPRPKKELVAFEKVYLEAGRSQKISLNISIPKVFDTVSKKMVTEKGSYCVYVGSSVKDIRLEGRIKAGDAELARTNEPLSRYLQSESNIISENYTLEARYPIMKKAIKNIACGAALLLLAVLLQIYCVSTNTSSAFLNIITVGLIGVGVALFILEAIDRKRMSEKEIDVAQKANEKWFEDATRLESFDADKMFADEFGTNEPTEVQNANEPEKHSNDDEYFAYVDKEFTFAVAADELELFLNQHGCKLDRSSVNDIISAMAASRLVILSGLGASEFEKLAATLSQYFDCSTYIDKIDKSYNVASRTFYFTDNSGNRSKTGALRVIEEAAKTSEKIHIASFAGLNDMAMENCFADIVRYAKSPYSSGILSAIEEKYRLSQNIWFIAGLEANKTLNDIPADIADVAAVLDIKMSVVAPSPNAASVHKFPYYQMEYMGDRVTGRCEIDENLWKKVDKLAEFVRGFADYSIGNKQWLSMERYVAVFVACRGEIYEALDRAVAARIVPSAIALTQATPGGAHMGLSDEIEKIFGENNAEFSRRVIRAAEVSRTVKNS